MLGRCIVADDRTGALETAAALADRLDRPIVVTVGTPTAKGFTVVDIGTRHLPPEAVTERLGEPWVGHVVGHKIDSLLRGNWSAELDAIQAATGKRVVVVPASPALGRICRAGIVTADGVAVDQLDDARRAAGTARPAEAIGAEVIQPLILPNWLRGRSTRAVCDAETVGDLAAIGATLAGRDDVVVAGTAAVLTEVFGGRVSARPGRCPEAISRLRPPIVAVVGSLHRTALAQAAALRAAGISTFTTDVRAGDDAETLLADLVSRARSALVGAATVVLVGGDTAAAVLGDEPMLAHGLLGPGVACVESSTLAGATVLAKPGSFGSATSLVELLSARMDR